MRLVARKPCSFSGRDFFIGDEIPADLVSDPSRQEGLGVLSVVMDNERAAAKPPEETFTREQVEKMTEEAVEEAVKNMALEMEQMQKELQEAAGVLHEEGFLAGGIVIIPVKGDSDGDNGQQTAVPAKPEEIQQVFSILQMNAEEGVREIQDVTSENVLILLHASDSRKTIRNAAREQAGRLFPAGDDPDVSGRRNDSTGTNTEGADT